MILKEPFKYKTLKGAYDSMRNQYDSDYIYNVESVNDQAYWIVKETDKSGDKLLGILEDY